MLFYSLPALIGFICGVHFGFSSNIAALFAAFALLCLTNKKTREMSLYFLVCGIFVFVGKGIIKINSAASCYTEQFVSVSGRISEIPYKSNNIWCYTLNCEEIKYADREEEFDERIMVYSDNEYKLGDSLEVSGFLKLFDEPKNPGCFDSFVYYKSLGITYKITAFSDCLSDKSYPLKSIYDYAVKLRNDMCIKIDERFSADNAAVLKYILTGYKKGLGNDYLSSLSDNGVLRNLYYPYFHLLLILALVRLLTRKAKLRRILVCLLCIIYLCINPYSLSARKLFTYTIFMEALRSRGVLIRPLDVLWTVILLCGIQNPYVLYNTGFIMSCVATIFIILFYTKIYMKISWINTHKAVIRVFVMFFISAVLLLPIGAFLFDGISPYSIFISVLLFPIISAIYIISPFALLGSDIAVLIVHNLLNFIRNLPIITEKLPLSFIMLPKLRFSLLLAYLFLLGAIYKKKLVFAMVTLGLSLSFVIGEIKSFNKAEFNFILAGQGDCSVLEIPYKCTIMVDTGGNTEYMNYYDVGAREIFPYLHHKNITTLDYVFISHYHNDHCQGLISLMDLVKIKNIFLPDYLPEGKNRVMIEEKAKEKGIKLNYIKEPGTIDLDGGVSCEVLYFDKAAENENDRSVVMRLEYGGISCLYTGDITKKTEQKLLENGIDVHADILKTPHHGSKYSSSDELLTAVDSEIAVAMAAWDNSYGFPTKETILNMKEAGIEFAATADVGSITIKNEDGRLIWQRKTH